MRTVKLESMKDPLNRKRLFLWGAAAMVVLVAAILLLPAGLVRMMLLALLAAPFGFVLFDKPRWTFYILLFIVFSNIHIFLSPHMIRVLMLYLFASMAVAVVGGRKLVINDRDLFLIIGAFLIMAFQSMAFARDIHSSIYRLSIFSKILFISFLTIQFSSDRKLLLNVLVIIAAAMVVNDFMPFIVPPPAKYGDLSLIWDQAVYRYEGYTREPNMFAFANIFSIPILFFLYAHFRKPRFVRPLILIVIGGSVFTLFLSFSRGGFIGLVMMFISLVFVERRNRKVVAASFILMVIFILMAPAVYWERLKSLANFQQSLSSDYAFMSRMEAMRVALILGIKHPLLGIGVENFRFWIPRYVPFGSFVHNSVLQVFSDMGIPALMVYLYLIIYNVRLTFRLMSDDDRELAQLGRILLVQQVAVQVNSMFLPVVWNLEFWLTLILPSIALYAYGRVKPRLIFSGRGIGSGHIAV